MTRTEATKEAERLTNKHGVPYRVVGQHWKTNSFQAQRVPQNEIEQHDKTEADRGKRRALREAWERKQI